MFAGSSPNSGSPFPWGPRKTFHHPGAISLVSVAPAWEAVLRSQPTSYILCTNLATSRFFTFTHNVLSAQMMPLSVPGASPRTCPRQVPEPLTNTFFSLSAPASGQHLLARSQSFTWEGPVLAPPAPAMLCTAASQGPSIGIRVDSSHFASSVPYIRGVFYFF